MRRLFILVFLIISTIFLFTPTQPVKAILRERFYTVRYACIISPDAYGQIVGEWAYYCDGTVDGWGWEPGHNCTYYELTNGQWCGPEQPQ